MRCFTILSWGEGLGISLVWTHCEGSGVHSSRPGSLYSRRDYPLWIIITTDLWCCPFASYVGPPCVNSSSFSSCFYHMQAIKAKGKWAWARGNYWSLSPGLRCPRDKTWSSNQQTDNGLWQSGRGRGLGDVGKEMNVDWYRKYSNANITAGGA